jgi:transcriptional regulator with XRE-family HTH domain
MKMINHLRELYGFPQAVLANYVGVSRGHLSMAAIGRKDLQTTAYLKLGKLALALKDEEGPEITAIKAGHRALLQQKEAAFVKLKILETQHRLMSCQRKLRRMQVKYRQAIHSIACLAVLQADPGDPDIIHYRVMEMDARKLLDKNSETAQFDLELRIEGLKATAEFLQRRVELSVSPAVLPTDIADPGMPESEPGEISTREPSGENVRTANREVASPGEEGNDKEPLVPCGGAIQHRRVTLPASRRKRYKVKGIPGRRLMDKQKAPALFDRGLRRNEIKPREQFVRTRVAGLSLISQLPTGGVDIFSAAPTNPDVHIVFH